MTALKPIENLRVRGVASERYPLNAVCAHPDCAEPTADPHHAFPRSEIGNDSWFVEIESYTPDEIMVVTVMPHVSGLCRAHHDDVEEHRAWIKLEDGVFVWYDHSEYFSGDERGAEGGDGTWVAVGPLNPQPGSREGKTKRKRKIGTERRKRRVISIRVPDDSEDGGALWDEALENVKARLIEQGLYDESDSIPAYEAVMAALNDWLSS